MPGNKRDLIEADIVAEKPSCPILSLLENTNMQFRIERLNAGKEKTNHLVSVEGMDADTYSALRRRSSGATRVNSDTCWLLTKSCEVCRLIAEERAISINIRPAVNSALRYRIIIPERSTFAMFTKGLEQTGLKFKISRIEAGHETLHLTKRQKQVIAMAYTGGYFDVDRCMTMTELAEDLGVSVRTVQEILRRGLRKIIDRYMFEEA